MKRNLSSEQTTRRSSQKLWILAFSLAFLIPLLLSHPLSTQAQNADIAAQALANAEKRPAEASVVPPEEDAEILRAISQAKEGLMARTAGYRYTGNGETMEYQEGQDIHQWLWDMEKRYDAGLYNGEKHPYYPGAVKVPGGWDLGPDPTYQAKLRQLYGEEDYALLNVPIRWERVPNIIGMDEQTALNALHAKGFAVRVGYRKTTDPSQDGKVYYQDIGAGCLFNTNAGLIISVYSLDREGERYQNPWSTLQPSLTPDEMKDKWAQEQGHPLPSPTPDPTFTPWPSDIIPSEDPNCVTVTKPPATPTPVPTPAPTSEPSPTATPSASQPSIEPSPEVLQTPVPPSMETDGENEGNVPQDPQ